MRKDWKIIPLKNLCNNYKEDIVDGPFGANLKREHFIDKGVPILKIQNIKPYEIVLKKMDYVSNEKASELQRHAYRSGDIIITKLGLPLGVSAIVEDIEDGLIVADLVRVRASKIDTKYLCYQLNGPLTNDFLNSQSGGATRPRVKIAAVRDLPIFTPPLPEQKRIVAILDEAFAGISQAIANTEKNLANARELFESQLAAEISSTSISTRKVTLSELATDITDGDHQPPPKRSDGIPFITISNIDKTTHVIDFSNTFKVPKSYYRNLKPHKKPSKGDLLYTVTGSFGIPVIVNTDRDFCFQRHIGLIRPKDDVSTKWLYYVLRSPDVRTQAESTATGTAQKTVSLKALREFSIPKIPISAQLQIVTRLDALSESTSKLALIYQQKLKALTELKQSILQKAFTGDLTQDLSL